MRPRALSCALALIALASAAFAQTSGSQPNDRNFSFVYAFTVRDVKPGQRISVWFPKAQSDKYQKVRLVSVNGDLPVKPTREAAFGNEMFYATAPKANRTEYHFEAKYEVTRHVRLGFQEAKAHPEHVQNAVLKRYLEPDRMVPVTGKPAEIAAKEVEGKNGTLEKARAMYDYVFRNMRYDKTGTGWGNGDAIWACDAKRGNCTDFHSLFAAMARSQGIPTRFEIGFPLPADKHEGEIAGYHCWSDFYVANQGWIPVDISEAWKHPEKKDYFFGSHDVNRVQFTVGRDITLNPKQGGEALNYFVYPYVEVDGKKYTSVQNSFSFADLPAKETQRASIR